MRKENLALQEWRSLYWTMYLYMSTLKKAEKEGMDFESTFISLSLDPKSTQKESLAAMQRIEEAMKRIHEGYQCVANSLGTLQQKYSLKSKELIHCDPGTYLDEEIIKDIKKEGKRVRLQVVIDFFKDLKPIIEYILQNWHSCDQHLSDKLENSVPNRETRNQKINTIKNLLEQFKSHLEIKFDDPVIKENATAKNNLANIFFLTTALMLVGGAGYTYGKWKAKTEEQQETIMPKPGASDTTEESKPIAPLWAFLSVGSLALGGLSKFYSSISNYFFKKPVPKITANEYLEYLANVVSDKKVDENGEQNENEKGSELKN